jgi:Rieske Fe-S protein
LGGCGLGGLAGRSNTIGTMASFDDLQRGKGAIIREGRHKIAAYRDDNGKLYRVSAACTHVGCHVHWNSFDRCWDCPCHGSHFAIDGTALNGPAVSSLQSGAGNHKAAEPV